MTSYEITVVSLTKREVVVKADCTYEAGKLAIKKANALVGGYEGYVENMEILEVSNE